MSKRYARSLFAVGAAVLAAVLGVTTVLAATSWTVRPGGPISMKTGVFKLTDTATGNTLTCPSSALSGTLKSGRGLSGTGIGSITAVHTINCPTPFGPSWFLMARDLPWRLSVLSYSATTGVVTGSLGHLQIAFSGPQCMAVIAGTTGAASDGTVKVRYSNSSGQLQIRTTGGNLHFYMVRGCAGLINTGDSVTLSANYTMSPKQAITSP